MVVFVPGDREVSLLCLLQFVLPICGFSGHVSVFISTGFEAVGLTLESLPPLHYLVSCVTLARLPHLSEPHVPL
jgi:hypothetical protein